MPYELKPTASPSYQCAEEPPSVYIYDIETSGLNQNIDQPIEICMIKLESGKEISRYCTLIQYERPLSLEIVALTSINDEMLLSGKTRKIVAQELHDFLGLCEKSPDIRICGHNLLRFDNFFLRRLFKEQLGLVINLGPFSFDTAAQFKAEKLNMHRSPGQKIERFHSKVLDIHAPGVKYNLLEAAKYYTIPIPTKVHRAEADTVMTLGIYLKQRYLISSYSE